MMRLQWVGDRHAILARLARAERAEGHASTTKARLSASSI
jgi:hypothetical protein